jgi:hypothetical protein
MIGGYGNFIMMDKSANACQNYIYQDQTSPVQKQFLEMEGSLRKYGCMR